MSSIQFESSREKEAVRDNVRRAREKILAEVKIKSILFKKINYIVY